MVMQFKRWISSVALSASLSVAMVASATGVQGRLCAADTTGSRGITTSVDEQKAAEKSFTDLYGKDEKAALSSKDPADNVALAKTLFADSQKTGSNVALVAVMRAHAATLLFRSNDKASYDLVLDLEKAALDADKADPITAAGAQATMLSLGIKEVPGADRAPLYGKLVGLYQTLASLQIKAHRADDAVDSLNQAANFANAANDKNANKDATALMLVLRPMSSNSAALSKDLDALQKTPDDKKLNTEAALFLLRDWGEADTAGTYAEKGDTAQLKGLAEMAKYEASGKSVSGMDSNAIKSLAEAYETWSKDGKDSKL
ncbi:MAG TPA: hypothetical protein VL860_06480, partial [Planctomycetota bacterium]|nr:hypothetical protein [Planctomycetota bacterium]